MTLVLGHLGDTYLPDLSHICVCSETAGYQTKYLQEKVEIRVGVRIWLARLDRVLTVISTHNWYVLLDRVPSPSIH